MKYNASKKSKIRELVFEEIARFAYEGGDASVLDDLPYKIVPGEIATYRDSIFLERAIVGERLRAAMGLSLRSMTEHRSVSEGVDMSMVGEKYYEPPLIDIIKFACHKCPEKRVYVTDGCQGCLARPCASACPKGAISIVNNRSVIDPQKCIKCGLCANVCPYNAIIKQDRPCVSVCGVNAIKFDEYGRAEIDHEKCASCGMCLSTCPFGAIVDKGQIYQTIKAMETHEVFAILAPAFAGQWPGLTCEKIRPAFQALGFTNVFEVAIGADMCTIQEANDFLKEVPEKLPFMATSCCPAWSSMARKNFPQHTDKISMALTPMVLTARLVKLHHPNAKIAFIGPCLAKKSEASRKSIKSYVDFTLTFEEVQGMFSAKGINFEDIPDDEPLKMTSKDGRAFASSGGVAQAVANYIKIVDPSRDVKIFKAEGLADCKKMLLLAGRGKYDGYLLEGMACPGGCINGAGNIQTLADAQKSLRTYMSHAQFDHAADTIYADWMTDLERIEEIFHEMQAEYADEAAKERISKHRSGQN